MLNDVQDLGCVSLICHLTLIAEGREVLENAVTVTGARSYRLPQLRVIPRDRLRHLLSSLSTLLPFFSFSFSLFFFFLLLNTLLV